MEHVVEHLVSVQLVEQLMPPARIDLLDGAVPAKMLDRCSAALHRHQAIIGAMNPQQRQLAERWPPGDCLYGPLHGFKRRPFEASMPDQRISRVGFANDGITRK